jgi:hypothetical protein
MWFATQNGFSPNQPESTEFQWVPDPVSQVRVALGANWGNVKPFVMGKPSDFQIDPPKTNDSDPDFQKWYHEVRQHGGDAHYNIDVSGRMIDQYFEGKFFSYDGTSGICAPVRLYNQIADTVLVQSYHDVAPNSPDLGMPDASSDAASDIAHYYALLNVALVDAGITAWHYKYQYQYWRPVTGVRYVDSKEAGAPPPQGAFEGEKLQWAPVWYALGAQTTNSASGYNITPPFPAYPSGHSVFGNAFFEVMRALVKTDKGFDFQSDELNGEQRLGDNVDSFNYVRCKKPTAATPDPDYDPKYCDIDAKTKRHFTSFKDAEQQNSDSRIFLGVHWRGDSDNGMHLGTEIGDAVLNGTSFSKVVGP